MASNLVVLADVYFKTRREGYALFLAELQLSLALIAGNYDQITVSGLTEEQLIHMCKNVRGTDNLAKFVARNEFINLRPRSLPTQQKN